MKLRPWILAIALAVAACGTTSSASAQDGYGFGIGLGFSQGYFQAMRGQRGRIPHFALYPPVYYGQKVARPYGYSPFAAPPGIVPVETQFVAPAEFKEIVNPYYRPSGEASSRASEAQEAPAPATAQLNPDQKT